MTPVAYELRTCPECEGDGSRLEIGDGPHDRPYLTTCTRCAGLGEAHVYLYEMPKSAHGLCEQRGSYGS